MVLEPDVVVKVTGQVVSNVVVTTVVMISDVETGGGAVVPETLVDGGELVGGLLGGLLDGGGLPCLVTGQTVVETAMIEVVVIVETLLAGQFSTSAAHEVITKV